MSYISLKVKNAINDQALGKAVLKSCNHSLNARERVIKDFDNLELLKSEARAVRQESIQQNEHLISEFVKKFEDNGGYVHLANTADEANELVVNILKKHNVNSGVKAKSMVTEEIHLHSALSEANIDAVESDLGEFIVQLLGQPPSHITAPAIHLSREAIGRLFAERLGIPYTDDPTILTQHARVHLRKRFLNAQFGISGANFLSAKTGHIVLVENEGNQRLGMSVPPLYIAVSGIDKVISNLQGVSKLLKLLARSATGQRATAYVNFLLPSKSNEDGAKEMHIVLLDNGRKRAMADPKMREMMLCIRCGACLNVCPVYQSIGGHAYDSIYPGPMGAILTNLLGTQPMSSPELPYLSTLCGACKEICPVKIDIPKLLLELRSRSNKNVMNRAIASGWRWGMNTKTRYELLGSMAKLTAKVFPKSIIGRKLKDKKWSFREQNDSE